MNRRASVRVAVLALAILLAALPATAAFAKAKPKPKPKPPKTRWAQRIDLENLAVKATNTSLKYLHGAWWASEYSYQSIVTTSASDDTTDTLEVANPLAGFSAGEPPIRSQASALYATAIALRDRTFSPKVVGVSTAEAQHRITAWANGLAYSYQVDGWQHSFQSALWVYYLSFGAHQNWAAIPPKTQQRIDDAVASEADYLLTKPPPCYRDATGTIVTPGDSKAEENAWNGTLLVYAARAYPSNPHAPQWEAQGRWYGITAYSLPSQVGSDARLTGSNLNPDGSVTNAGRPVYPDYMMTQCEFVAKNNLIAVQTNTAVCSEIANNQSVVWHALTKVKYPVPAFGAPGGTIYRVGSKSVATPNIYYPSGTSKSKVRKFNAAQTDVEAFAARIEPKAYDWAHAHLTAVLQQQARHKDGRVFSSGETRFPEDEQFAAASEAEMAYRLMLIR